MTLGAVLRRRWRVVVVGVILTVFTGVWMAWPQPSYSIQNDLVFVAPGATLASPADDAVTQELAAFAAVVERRYNRGPVFRLSRPDAPMYGAGKREGVFVTLPNLGNQWVNAFLRPALSVEVNGNDPDALIALHDQTVEELRRLSNEVQDEAGVPWDARITASPIAARPKVNYVGSNDQGTIRALAAVAAAGLIGTLSSAVLIDRWRLRRRLAASRRVVVS
ncbi:MAG: hypothetical protein QM708_11490 [Propioniciclava sp.]|uniref:hypothetical protein n=1 Tax=Propioniciclava sp. TaxID=2038686 RepID=UPI0039E44926